MAKAATPKAPAAEKAPVKRKAPAKAAASPASFGAPAVAAYESFRKDGTSIWIESTYSRLNDGSSSLLVASRDITDRKQLQLDLAKALELAT